MTGHSAEYRDQLSQAFVVTHYRPQADIRWQLVYALVMGGGWLSSGPAVKSEGCSFYRSPRSSGNVLKIFGAKSSRRPVLGADFLVWRANRAEGCVFRNACFVFLRTLRPPQRGIQAFSFKNNLLSWSQSQRHGAHFQLSRVCCFGGQCFSVTGCRKITYINQMLLWLLRCFVVDLV